MPTIRGSRMPGSNNKLDYLSKYMGDGGGGSGEKDKKKKKRTKKDKKRSDPSTIQLRDEDAALDDVLVAPPDADDDVLEDEDEGPLVVNDVGIAAASEETFSKGRWDNQEADHGGTTSTKGKIRRRHDSFSSKDNNQTSNSMRGKKRRRDSSSSASESSRPQRRRRHDSDPSSASASSDDQKRSAMSRHSRHDSDASSSSNADRQGRRRHDSSASSSDDNDSNPPPRSRRHDSSDDESSNDGEHDSKARMASGHVAGLQDGARFAESEAKLQKSRRRQAAALVDQYGAGDTVYRDKASGARVEGAPPPQGKDSNRKQQLTPEQQRLLNMGTAQLQQQEQAQQEFARLQQASFARRVDDNDLDSARRDEIRADDPMAAYAARKQQKQQKGPHAANTSRPVYKGPPPKPNRYGIPPGHRWDAKDRGNGFEDKLLAQRYSMQHQKERAYRYSAADM